MFLTTTHAHKVLSMTVVFLLKHLSKNHTCSKKREEPFYKTKNVQFMFFFLVVKHARNFKNYIVKQLEQ